MNILITGTRRPTPDELAGIHRQYPESTIDTINGANIRWTHRCDVWHNDTFTYDHTPIKFVCPQYDVIIITDLPYYRWHNVRVSANKHEIRHAHDLSLVAKASRKIPVVPESAQDRHNRVASWLQQASVRLN